MKRVSPFSLLLLGLLAAIGSCRRDAEVGPAEDCLVKASARNGEILPGEFIVSFQNPIVSGPVEARVADVSGDILATNRIDEAALEQTFAGATSGFVAHLSDEQVARLRQDPRVTEVEPDRVVSMCACLDVAEPRSLTWDVRKTGYGNGLNFSQKTAWIIDTGIDLDHPDLNVDRDRSRSFITGQASADDENGHGTHVAGIIGALNNRQGTVGVASGAKLVALKVLNQLGEGRISGIISAVVHVSQNGRSGDVVNLSLGGEGTSAILDREVKNAADRGILFAIAAGNEGQAARNFSPGRFNHANVFTVSAVDSTDAFASFSNFGNDVVDVAAYGVKIPSTYRGGRYAILSGTSMAAPHVAGLLLIRGRQFPTRGTARNDPDGQADRIARE
ncbi:MAG: S8 family serine peptidase [Cytophagaceae bacterium]|nr:S8 family serine peptidase [Cytophagaceae bacterium]